MSEVGFLKETTILAILEEADTDDLITLTDYITDSGKGRLSLAKIKCDQLVQAKNFRSFSDADKQVIEEEISLFGGNSIVNLVRRSGVTYEEIVRDVAKHLKVNFSKTESIVAIEQAVLAKLLSSAIDQMSEEERKELLEELGITNYSVIGPSAAVLALGAAKLGGFATYKLAAIVANAIAKAILGRGLTFAATGKLMRAISFAIGPIGWVITGLWTAADLASPAYRVTVPCIIHLSYMRQKMLLEQMMKQCKTCNSHIVTSSKFCQECGNPV